LENQEQRGWKADRECSHFLLGTIILNTPPQQFFLLPVRVKGATPPLFLHRGDEKPSFTSHVQHQHAAAGAPGWKRELSPTSPKFWLTPSPGAFFFSIFGLKLNPAQLCSFHLHGEMVEVAHCTLLLWKITFSLKLPSIVTEFGGASVDTDLLRFYFRFIKPSRNQHLNIAFLVGSAQ